MAFYRYDFLVEFGSEFFGSDLDPCFFSDSVTVKLDPKLNYSNIRLSVYTIRKYYYQSSQNMAFLTQNLKHTSTGCPKIAIRGGKNKTKLTWTSATKYRKVLLGVA